MTGSPGTLARGAVWLAIAAGVIAATHVGKMAPALPLLRGEFAFSLPVAGLVVSAFNGIGALFGLVAGRVADRFGHRRVLIGGLLLQAVGATVGATAAGVGLLLGGRLLEGIGFVATAVSAPVLVVQATAGQARKRALGVWSIYVPAGVSAAAFAAPLLLDLGGWRGLWIATAALSLGWALLVLALVPAAQPRVASGGLLPATLLLPRAWLLGAAFGSYALQWLSLMVWMPTYMTEQRDVSTTLAANLTALAVAANIAGCLGGAALLGRDVPRWRLVLAASATMAAMVPLIFVEALPDGVRYAACLLFSAGGGLLPPAVLAAAPVFAASAAEVGAMNGVIVAGSNLGQLIGPPLTGLVATLLGGWSPVAAVMLASACLGITAAFVVRRAERRITGHPPG